jgi:broad specificity phosphatase PhoE
MPEGLFAFQLRFPENSRMTIYLLRHGQSEANHASLFSGVSDHPLTAKGREQARQAGQQFTGCSFDHLFTSQLSRAIETADLFLAASGAKIGSREARAELNERNFGTFEGAYQPPLDQMEEADIRWRICQDVEFAPPGGESMRQTHIRAVHFLEDIRASLRGDILIVAHGNILRSMTLHALGWPVEMLPEMPSRNCLVTRLGW